RSRAHTRIARTAAKVIVHGSITEIRKKVHGKLLARRGSAADESHFAICGPRRLAKERTAVGRGSFGAELLFIVLLVIVVESAANKRLLHEVEKSMAAGAPSMKITLPVIEKLIKAFHVP